jgi:sec-independent protein translocase protein TatA
LSQKVRECALSVACVVRKDKGDLMLGTGEIVMIVGAVVVLFGAEKLPRLGSAIGESIKNFKKGIRSEEEEEKQKEKSIENSSKEKISSQD